jgi:ArsR family transcriptional regulator
MNTDVAPNQAMEAAADLELHARMVADILRELANEKRLLILCRLVETGEMRALDLAHSVGLGQSALSQHLARLRECDLVTYRRDSQTLWYRIADPRIEQLMAQLHSIFCPAPEAARPQTTHKSPE